MSTGASSTPTASGWPQNRNAAEAFGRSLEAAGLELTGGGHRALVMLSGGLDSVALLALVLAETDHHVHAHHIELHNFEGRAIAELHALDRVREWFADHERPFDYTTSVAEFPFRRGGGYDMALSLFVASRICYSIDGVDAVLTGHIFPRHRELAVGMAVYQASFGTRRVRPPWLWPFSEIPAGRKHKRKIDVYESIPPDLAERCWSCRTPVHPPDGGYEPCGECHACVSVAAARAG